MPGDTGAPLFLKTIALLSVPIVYSTVPVGLCCSNVLIRQLSRPPWVGRPAEAQVPVANTVVSYCQVAVRLTNAGALGYCYTRG